MKKSELRKIIRETILKEYWPKWGTPEWLNKYCQHMGYESYVPDSYNESTGLLSCYVAGGNIVDVNVDKRPFKKRIREQTGDKPPFSKEELQGMVSRLPNSGLSPGDARYWQWIAWYLISKIYFWPTPAGEGSTVYPPE